MVSVRRKSSGVNARAQSARGYPLLRPLALTAVVFFSVSGGPYGLEPLLNLVGARNGFLLILWTPIIWAIPVILMVLELNGLMPRTGGYYQWVRAGLGRMWGFLEGWWTWEYMFVDLAIYPVLFVEYASFFLPGIAAYRYLLCLAIIWSCAGLNLLGILPVGRGSIAFGFMVILPFLVLFAFAFHAGFSLPLHGHFAGTPEHTWTAFGLGLFTVMWNFLGWDNVSTFAEEVYRPVRSYLVAMIAALILIIVTYALTVIAASGTNVDPEKLELEGFPLLGQIVGGPGVGALISVGGMASALGLFGANLLSVSRLPKAMADDGLLPRTLGRVDPHHGVPHVSIATCATIVSIMVLWRFEDLLIIDVTLYGCALFLEFIALIALRRLMPNAARPFRIPLNQSGLLMLVVCPFLCFISGVVALVVKQSPHTGALIFATSALLTGPLFWLMVSRSKLRPSP